MNILVVGYGGQGVITLAHVIGRAAFKEGFDVKQAELHGLSQRMGSLQCHVRIGKKVFSPMSRKKDVDVVIALELTEALRAEPYVSKEKTKLLANKKILKDDPLGEDLDERVVEEKLREIYKEVEIVDAERKIKEVGGNITMTNTFMLAYAVKKGYLPISKEKAWEALSEKIRPTFLEDNKKIFEKAFE